MIDPKTAGIVLVKNGTWQVPASARPRGWEFMKLKEPEHNPTEEQVAEAVASVSQASTEKPPDKSRPTRRYPEKKLWDEITATISESAKWFGADVYLVEACQAR